MGKPFCALNCLESKEKIEIINKRKVVSQKGDDAVIKKWKKREWDVE
jgi:hypothetical protein